MDLFLESDFISSLIKIYASFKESIKDIIKPIIEEKSKEFINNQAKIEQKYGNMNINNKRTFNKFKQIIEIFLEQNYNFFVQHYIIEVIIQPNKLFHSFLSSITNEFGKTSKRLTNYNNNDEDGNLIRVCLKKCFDKRNISIY